MEDPSQVALLAQGLTEGAVQLQVLSLARAGSCEDPAQVWTAGLSLCWLHGNIGVQGKGLNKGLHKQLHVGVFSPGRGFSLHQRDGFAQSMARRTTYPTRSLLTVRNKPC